MISIYEFSNSLCINALQKININVKVVHRCRRIILVVIAIYNLVLVSHWCGFRTVES